MKKDDTNLNFWAISDEMFEWIKANLEEGKTILEFGSGTGTIELTKHWTVYSVEQNEQWLNKAPDSHYIHAPLKDHFYLHTTDKDTWYDEAIVFNNIPEKYDLLLVDGPQGSDVRKGIDKYIDRFRTDVPILLDDTHRDGDRNHAIQLAETLGREWEEIVGWQKNFIVIKVK